MIEGLSVEVQAAEGVAMRVGLERLEAAALHVLRAEAVDRAQISVTLLDDAGIAELNERYLDHPGPTDVISFPLEGPAGVVGDVYVGAEQAHRQAIELGLDPGDELVRLTIHGVLHVLGYDHPDDADREGAEMYRRQEELLASFQSITGGER